LEQEEQIKLLALLLKAHPELQDEAEALAVKIITTVNPETVAAEVISAFHGFDQKEIWDRSGKDRSGNKTGPMKAAGEICDEKFEPLMEPLERLISMGQMEAALFQVKGLLNGLYRLEALVPQEAEDFPLKVGALRVLVAWAKKAPEDLDPWENARSQVPTQRANLAQTQHRLELLLGLSPGGLEVELERSRPIPCPPARIAIGIPAEVLRQRPDIREAEQQLAYQTASIGVAMADKYPQLTWSGTIGLESQQTGNLISPASRLFQFGPSLSWNLFDAGTQTTALQPGAVLTRFHASPWEAQDGCRIWAANKL
jgi:hypothetical protein